MGLKGPIAGLRYSRILPYYVQRMGILYFFLLLNRNGVIRACSYSLSAFLLKRNRDFIQEDLGPFTSLLKAKNFRAFHDTETRCPAFQLIDLDLHTKSPTKFMITIDP